jgi:hypothetical protein
MPVAGLYEITNLEATTDRKWKKARKICTSIYRKHIGPRLNSARPSHEPKQEVTAHPKDFNDNTYIPKAGSLFAERDFTQAPNYTKHYKGVGLRDVVRRTAHLLPKDAAG